MSEVTLLRGLAAATSAPIGASTDDDEPRTAFAIFSAVASNVLLFVLVFGLSATVQFQTLRREFENKKALLFGLAVQFLLMPLLGYLAVWSMSATAAGFTEAMGLTLLVLTASPAGSFSNWWCSMFNAELALSVAMTTISSVLSVGFLPANLFLYTHLAYDRSDSKVVESINFSAIFLSLAVVLGAIFSGILAGYKWNHSKFHIMANHLGTVAGLLLVIFSIFLSSGAEGAKSKLWNQEWSFYVGVMSPCIVGAILPHVIARAIGLTRPQTVAVSIQCCYRNTAIATSMAVTVFRTVEERAQAVAVPLFYGVVEAIVVGTYCLVAWKMGWTKAPVNENICVVLTKTYEVGSEGRSEHDDNDNTDMELGVETIMDPDNHSQVVLEQEQDEEERSYHSAMDEEWVPPTQPLGWFARISHSFWRRRADHTTGSSSRHNESRQRDQKKSSGQRPRLASDMTLQTVTSTSSHSVLQSILQNTIEFPTTIRSRASTGLSDSAMIPESVAEGLHEDEYHSTNDDIDEEVCNGETKE